MADLMLFHHAQGRTDGIEAFADQLRRAGHQVTVPDLYDGATFGTIEEGVAHAEDVGFDNIIDAGVAAAKMLPAGSVCGGFSLGALVAHKLAQTRPGILGALLYHHGDVPITTFGESWPAGVDVQIHVNEHDEWAELDTVRDFVARAKARADAELFLYAGSTHLFTDSSLSDYERESTELVLQRTLEFLQRPE
jgi:dienelactone hydrolase